MHSDSEKTLGAIEYALEQVGIGIHFVASDGRFIDVNDAACSMLGYTRDEMLQMSVPDIDENVTHEGFAAAAAQLREHPARFETKQRTKDGRVIDTEVIMHYVRDDPRGDEQGYFVAFQIDLGERKREERERQRLQHQLLQAQKMESIGHLAGGIAHDFNNMLAVMLGYTELSLLQLKGCETLSCTQKLHENLAQITSAGQRARELIAQMLVFSRRATEEEQEEVPLTLLSPVVKEVSKMLRSSLPATIDINCRIENGAESVHSRIEPIKLHQILLNLGINARDAMGGKGVIDIQLRRIHGSGVCVSCHDSFHGEYAELVVSDNGRGMPAEILANIFHPFFTTKEVGKGTGMGLSVVHGLVHGAGGHIQLQSAPGTGTTVTLYLPLQQASLAEQAEQARAPAREAAASLEGKRIMVVDDEEAIAAMLDDLLTLHGAQVHAFTQVEAALGAFDGSAEGYDLVVTDQTMPGMSGLEMSCYMLQRQPSLPVIICTGYSENVDPEVAQRHGIAGFLFKPLSSEQLLGKILELTS